MTEALKRTSPPVIGDCVKGEDHTKTDDGEHLLTNVYNPTFTSELIRQ